MLIFVEGNEGTGKTTLINQLIKEVPAVVVKYPKEVKNVYRLLDKLRDSKQIVIFDRGLITDLVYRMWDHKPGQMSLSKIGEILDWPDIVIIFCNHKKGYENAMKRGEDFITDPKVYEIIDDNFFRVKTMIECFTDAKTFSYNYEYQDVNDVIKCLKEIS